jgi:hypothetical protein
MPETLEEKLVSEYTGLTFFEVDNLCIFYYWQCLRDALIYKWTQTEGGNNYLDKCWRLEQTEPNRVALREKFGGE